MDAPKTALTHKYSYRCIYMYVAIYIDSLYMLLYESFTLAMSKYILRYSHRTTVYIPNPNDSNLYKTDIRTVSSHKQTKHMHRAPKPTGGSENKPV